MKKTLAVLFAALMLLTPISGCSREETPPVETPAEPSVGNPSSLFAVVEEGDVLPSLYITTATGRHVLEKEYEKVTVSASGSAAEKFDFTDLPAEMKCRGNATFNMDKKSYRIRFEEKINLFGQGRGPARSWVLLAEHCDQSLLRNHVAFAMAKKLDGIGFSSSSSFVKLYLNGVYSGIYHLAEPHDTGKYRVRAEEDPTEPDTDYFVELDSYGDYGGDDTPYSFEVDDDTFVVQSDTMTVKKFRFILSFFLDARKAIISGKREKIEDYIDVPSFVDTYILQEVTKNIDVGWSSFFYLKKAGGVIYCTCPWDFDLAFGNDARLDDGDAREIYVADPETVYGSRRHQVNGHRWFVDLMSRRWFVDLVRERWFEVRDALKETAIGEIDRITENFGEQMASNFDVWQIFGEKINEEPRRVRALSSYEEHTEYLKNWIETRFEWLDGYFSDPEQCYGTVID